MTKAKATKKTEEQKVISKVEKQTLYYLASKADHIIEVQYNGQTVYIQPFGRIKIAKENIKINSDDARYLTFIKA